MAEDIEAMPARDAGEITRKISDISSSFLLVSRPRAHFSASWQRFASRVNTT
jgi:hypothetical protein